MTEELNDKLEDVEYRVDTIESITMSVRGNMIITYKGERHKPSKTLEVIQINHILGDVDSFENSASVVFSCVPYYKKDYRKVT